MTLVEAVVICGAHAQCCRCGLKPGHGGPHRCGGTEGDRRCTGAWEGDIDGDDFRILVWPVML